MRLRQIVAGNAYSGRDRDDCLDREHCEEGEKTTMAAPKSNPHCDLGEIICNRTPYKKMELPEHWEDRIEWDTQTGDWNFRGVARRVAKALRIPVIITYYNSQTGEDETYQDWLLIGYEGAGGE